MPDNYLCGDTETSGVVVNQDLILQLGYCLVENRKAVDTQDILLNWPDSGLVPEEWLRDRLEETRKHVEFGKDGRATGKHYRFTYDLLQIGRASCRERV